MYTTAASHQAIQPAPLIQNVAPLPPGWTEHKAPTGHIYYHNKALNKSTYTRPEPLPTSPPPHVEQQAPEPQLIPSYTAGQFAGGFSSAQFQPPPGQHQHQHTQRKPFQKRQDNDRPKHKYVIPGCAPWVLIKTKYGRRFVHNTETNESFWKFPEDVMKGVVEFDRKEREKQARRERGEPSEDEEEVEAGAVVPVKQADGEGNGEESEYEEIEVTDSEGEGEAGAEGLDSVAEQEEQGEGPREFTEEDMLWQLEGMQQDAFDEAMGDEEYYEEEEPPLSEEDSRALFRDLLDDHKLSPFTPWDRIIEEGQIIDDGRYTALPNMKARRDVFDEWSRERIQQLRELREQQAKQDPRIPFLQLLDEHASPKLYWPEFKRKFRKESAMKDMKLADKEKEKLYREHIKRLALPKDSLKKDLSALLKSIPLTEMNRSTTLDNLPKQLITDLKFISLPAKRREPVIADYIATLPPAPQNGASAKNAAAEAEKKREREKREKALREREERVQEAKRKGQRDVRVGRERLREREEELDRAMRVDKQGLKSYLKDDQETSAAREDEHMSDA